MKKVAVEQTQDFKNSDLCVATEYGFGDADIDISTAVINGRYPDAESGGGYCVNTQVKEMILCLEGSGEIHTEKEVFAFKKGDAILIEKGEKYYWVAHCKVAMACTPAWHPDQHLIVD